MKVDALDILTILTIFQLLFFVLFLFVRRGRRLSRRLLGVHLLTQALGILGGFVDYNQFDFFYRNFPHLFHTGVAFSFLWGPTFYLYVKSFAFSDFRLRWRHVLHALPFALIVLYMLPTYFVLDAESKRLAFSSSLVARYQFPLNILRFIQILAYNMACLGVLRYYSGKIKESFSSIAQINLAWLKLIIVGFICAYAVSLSLYPPIVYLDSYRDELLFMVYLVYFTFFNTIFFKGLHQEDVFGGIEETVKYKSSALTREEAAAMIEKINRYVSLQKPHLTPGITIDDMAGNLGLSKRTLSQVLNEYFGQNFYDYVNKLRIEEAKRMLLEPECRKTVLEVLYEVGYNSKSSFNTEFKKATGLTPTEFRRRAVSYTVPEGA
jgi:AraC-like DNA-binding protein